MILSPIFSVLAGVANAFMDNSAENNFVDNKYNKTKGGSNDEKKWAQPQEIGTRKWWYLWVLHTPRYKESFIWSSTILVSLTDWWHKFQTMMIVSFCMAIVLYVPITVGLITYFGWWSILVPIIDFLIFRILFSLSFQYTYEKIKRTMKARKGLQS